MWPQAVQAVRGAVAPMPLSPWGGPADAPRPFTPPVVPVGKLLRGILSAQATGVAACPALSGHSPDGNWLEPAWGTQELAIGEETVTALGALSCRSGLDTPSSGDIEGCFEGSLT